MFNFVYLPSAHHQSSEQTADSLLICGHGSLTRLSGSVCVCTVQTLRCCRVHQRLHCQLSSSLPSGETLRGPPQKGHPPPTGGGTETDGSVKQRLLGSSVTLEANSLLAKNSVFQLFAVRFWKCPHPDLYLMQVTNGKVPTSILKRPCPIYGSDTEHNHRRKGERRVRFREPETTVHGE